MHKTPFRVLILPFCKTVDGHFEYALFKRTSEQYWRGIAGMGEVNELPIKVARREAFKEAYIPIFARYFLLRTIVAIPTHVPADFDNYCQRDHYVIPVYYFAVDCADIEIVLSGENLMCKWIEYEDAYELLHRDGDKTAFWELNERLLNDDLPPPI